jgi:hypothetical protein
VVARQADSRRPGGHLRRRRHAVDAAEQHVGARLEHGDVSYNIDGATVNWPGGGGGATMLYYDQGMFEEVNYMTSAIPAEVMAGGISINMVTKDAATWRGNMRYSFANEDLQSENHLDIQEPVPSFLGNPTLKTYDFNLSGGGAIIQNRLWVNGTVRRWIVNKLTNTRNSTGRRRSTTTR